jgi:hypothetical protein
MQHLAIICDLWKTRYVNSNLKLDLGSNPPAKKPAAGCFPAWQALSRPRPVEKAPAEVYRNKNCPNLGAALIGRVPAASGRVLRPPCL